MDIEYHSRKPQDDVPTEVIIHHIVKDYKRMFLTYDEMQRRAEKAEAKILELKDKHKSQLAKRDKDIELLMKELEDNNKEKIQEIEGKLAAAQQQNRLLAQAVISQNSHEDGKILFQGMVPTDSKVLEKKIDVQLRDALIKLTAVEERLANYQDALENIDEQLADNVSMKSFLARIAKSFGKINSAVQHIENFYKLANGIPMV